MVDDEPIVVTVLERYLREAAFFVGCAHSGAEAMRVFAQGPWDLVITDRAMPDMDGEQLAERIKIAAPGTPVILITGLARPGIAIELFEEVLRKPFSKQDLLLSIGRVLGVRAQPKPCPAHN